MSHIFGVIRHVFARNMGRATISDNYFRDRSCNCKRLVDKLINIWMTAEWRMDDAIGDKMAAAVTFGIILEDPLSIPQSNGLRPSKKLGENISTVCFR